MIRVPQVVGCRIGFHLLFDRCQQGGVLKRTKTDHFQVFLTVWVLFPKFLGRLKSGLW